MKRMIVVLLLCGIAVAVDKKAEPLLVPAVKIRVEGGLSIISCPVTSPKNSNVMCTKPEYIEVDGCEDKSRILLTAEDGKKWCLRTKETPDGR